MPAQTILPKRAVHSGRLGALVWLLLLAGSLNAVFGTARQALAAEPPAATKCWHYRVTENFRVYGADASLVSSLSVHCEAQREKLSRKWLGPETGNTWGECRCAVVVHPTAAAYAAAVGRGGEQSTGCSTTRVHAGRIIYRRIDLRADRGNPLTAALPHELTHVVLADKFLDRPLPRWADEGMAVLADPVSKQQAHQRDAELATFGAIGFSVRDLLEMPDYPPTNRQVAFYSQSASLVKFLVSLDGFDRFVNFVDRSMTQGSDEALRATYHIQSVAELEGMWRKKMAETLVARE